MAEEARASLMKSRTAFAREGEVERELTMTERREDSITMGIGKRGICIHLS